jgi:hypothetical protein
MIRIRMGPTQMKGEVLRAQGQLGQIKSDFHQYKQDAKDAKQFGKDAPNKLKDAKSRAQSAAQKVGQKGPGSSGSGGGSGVKVVGSGAPKEEPPSYQQQQYQGSQKMSAPGQAPVAMAVAGASGMGAAAPALKPQGFKMGLFSKKKKCPQCGAKLHASWDECPYCGFGRAGGAPAGAASAPMPSAGVKQRTVAMNIGGGGGGGGVSGSMSDGLIGWFIPLEGRQSGELFQLRGRVTVGTSDDNDIVMQDSPSISGHHCEFVATQGGFKLNDLGSTNGTYVNDKRVNTHDLVDNDNVRLGKVHFKYKSMI